MSAHLAQSSEWIGLAAIALLVIAPNAALAVWALRNPNERRTDA